MADRLSHRLHGTALARQGAVQTWSTCQAIGLGCNSLEEALDAAQLDDRDLMIDQLRRASSCLEQAATALEHQRTHGVRV